MRTVPGSSGRHIARPKRYLRDYGVELDDPDLLAAEVATQARAGDGWVKLVGDWIDRDLGDLAPLWTREQLDAAVVAAHDNGARITAHVFGADALPDIVGAGFDSIEHGTGLDEDLIDEMVRRDIALVPTLIQLETFPDIAAGADRFPKYKANMLALHAGRRDVFAQARKPEFASMRAPMPAGPSRTAASSTRSRPWQASDSRRSKR